jgi:hypothetical protein
VALFACPWEILPDGATRTADAKAVAAMARALALLGYDAGVMTRTEAEAVAEAGAAMPSAFTVAGPEPDVSMLEVAGIPVGVVRFPAGPRPGQAVPAETVQATARAAASLRGKARLVVGLSGWGATAEEAFINAHPGAVDLLLGGGPGGGLPVCTAGGGRTLWSRAFFKGKTVNRLDLYSLPEKTDSTWDPNTDFRSEIISLDDRYPADPEIAKMF